MQITILSVAAKPQQFFKGKKNLKKKSVSLSSLKYLNFEVSEGKVPTLVHVVFETWVKNPPPSKKQRGKSVPRGEEGWSQECWAHCVDPWCAVFWVKGTRGTETSSGASWQEAAFFAGLSARGGGERTGWCHLVECRGLLCSLSPCKVPCQWALLQSRQAEGVRESSRRLIAGRLGAAWAHAPHSLTLGRQPGWGTSPMLRPHRPLVPQGPLGHTAPKVPAKEDGGIPVIKSWKMI